MSFRFIPRIQPSGAWNWLKSKPAVIRYLVIGLLIASLFVASVLLWSVLEELPFWFWELTVLCVLIVGAVWWFTRGSRSYDRRRLLRQELGDLRAGDSVLEAEPRRRLRAAIEAALTTIRRSPQLETGAAPLYYIPWFLFVGDAQASQEQLLSSATRVASPFPVPHETIAEDSGWSFWFFKRMVAIKTSATFVCDGSDTGPRGIWYHALQLLHEYRERLPINGVVVVVAVERLVEASETLRGSALNIRRVVDEAMHHLEVDVPLYLVFTGLDRLPGFAALGNHIPANAKDHAVGERIDWDKPDAWSRWERAGDIFQVIRARLYAIRLAALRRETDRVARKDIYEFVERFSELKDGFATLLHALLDKNPFQHQPKLRGVYFATTGDPPIFVKDLFTRFFPADQSLADRAGRYARRRGVRSAVGAICLVLLLTGLLYGLVSAFLTDRELSSLSRAACPVADASDSERALLRIIECHERLADIERRWLASGLSFGLTFHRKQFREAQQRFVEAFDKAIIGPLDAQLSSSIASGRFGPGEYVQVIQRLGTLKACKGSTGRCRPFAVQFVFNSNRAARSGIAQTDLVTQKQNEQLFGSYVSFTRWHDAGELASQANRLNGYLEQMHHIRPLQLDEWLDWAAAHYDTYSLDRFWKPPRGIESGQRGMLPHVPALFTISFYQEVISPLQSTVHTYIPSAAQPLDTFVRGYLATYFNVWATFFRDFYQGSRLWSPNYAGLARYVVDQSPYEELYVELEKNMWQLPLSLKLTDQATLLWLDVRGDWLQTFHHLARAFRRLRAGVDRGAVEAPTWLLAVTDAHKRMWWGTSSAAKKILTFVQQDTSGQQTYVLAKEIFRSRGAGATGLAKEFQELDLPFDSAPDKYVHAMKGDNQIAWAGMRGLARTVLIILAGRAGQYVQRLWEEDILKAASSTSKAMQDVLLWGDNGKIGSFLTDQLGDFVTAKERTPVRVLDISLPFSPGYDVVVNKLTASGGRSREPFLVGSFTFKQPSTFGSLEEGAGGSEFSLTCRGAIVTLKSKAKLTADRSMKIYWSPDLCDRARIEVSLPDIPPTLQQRAASNNVPLITSLAKDYLGRDGFEKLLQEFKSGSRSFAVSEFKPSYPPAEWPNIAKSLAMAGVNAVSVHLSIDRSPELEQFLQASAIVAGQLPQSIMQ